MKRLRGAFPGVVEIPQVQPYLDQLLRRVQAAAPQPPLPVRVAVMADASYNVVTDKYGIIHIPLGVLNDIDSEPELAAWLAHEYGHVMLKHLDGGQRALSRVMSGAVNVVRVRVGRQELNVFNGLGVQAAQEVWMNRLRPAWSRTQELDADTFALNVMRGMGFGHAASTKRFLGRIRALEASTAKQESNRGQPADEAKPAIRADDDHPTAEQRLDAIQAVLNAQPKAPPRAQVGQDGWQVIRAKPLFKDFLAEAKLVSELARTLPEGRPLGQGSCRTLKTLGVNAKTGTLAFASAVGVCAGGQAQVALLERVAKRPDAPFYTYVLLADGLRETRQYSAAIDLMSQALDRYDYPDYGLALALSFYRRCEEVLQTDSQGPALGMDSLRIQAKKIELGARCQLFAPDEADACEVAVMTDEQRRAKADKKEKMEREMADKLSRKFGG
ncbi:M48 family metalloprotease [Aquabacterium sp.]|uniref:M48 family metalloprotease n=1 Tax=Aquabacterium sp. TaxID=1872578 RepID=UPI002E372A82|nr:M48 family metalloprotease [Aquabacterium sp.]HEX5313159.1 M48 family metalloprotease [Aquabacterium sp.]